MICMMNVHVWGGDWRNDYATHESEGENDGSCTCVCTCEREGVVSGVCVLDSVGALNFDSLCLLFLVVDKRSCVIYDLFQCRVFVCVEKIGRAHV